MKFEIETYKGQTIEYDDDNDKFICDISIQDKWKSTKRGSLNDARKEIDAFIKLNVDFKPFKVLTTDGWDENDFKILNVSAIRTDGKFVTYTDGNEGYKSYSGKKEMLKWKAFNAEVVKEKIQLQKVKELAISNYSKAIKELTAKLIPADLSKYEHIINPED